MRQVLRSTVLLALAGGAAAASAVLVGVDRSDLVRDGYLVFLAVVVALGAARIAAVSFPSPRGVVPRAIARPHVLDDRPESLARLEDVVALAQADQMDLHFRLRPLLADVAAAACGVPVTGGEPGLPAKAETEFSPETWALIRPDRPRPERQGTPGISGAALATVLEELESKLPP